MTRRTSNPSDGPYNIRALCRLETIDNLRTLKRIRDNEKAPAVARIRAVEVIFDRAFGKPTQQVELMDAGNVEQMTDAELQEIVRSSIGGNGIAPTAPGSGKSH